ncbi:MAG: hypothetical protein FVQ79_11075 [Planctomycetes bacterium]|nr:hypothetical protein [Planctomycetota bacterium]
MFRKMLLLLVAIGCVLCYSGCKKDPDVEIKSAEEYKAEAEKEINSSNMMSELDKIENEVEAEIAAE